MGLFSNLFRNKQQDKRETITSLDVKDTSLQLDSGFLPIHRDIKDLLWIGDGKYKNYTKEPPRGETINISGVSINISFGVEEEPSLLYMNLPICNDDKPVERPPYYPSYKSLSPSQRGVYWKLLSNPYDNSIDIGYVFILYYGLERFLLSDKYEQAVDLIVKLRDVHSNKSFQRYSANAVILTCLKRQRADIVKKFIDSLDKDYEYNFSPNLFLLCKYSLGLPIYSEEIMRMAKTFDFTKQNYIKSYPDLFRKKLTSIIEEEFGTETVSLNKILSDININKLSIDEIPIFANISIIDKTIKVPSIAACSELKMTLYGLLNRAHEEVKKTLSESKKNGEPIKKASQSSLKEKTNDILLFDSNTESELLKAYTSAKNNSLNQHFASISLQDFYYKYRELDSRYLDKCISYCRDDISRLSAIQKDYVEEEKNKIKSYPWLSDIEKQKKISEIIPFYANIPAFKRLAIVYEKEKEYDLAIDICNQAISYYSSGNFATSVKEFEERRNKIIGKLEKMK